MTSMDIRATAQDLEAAGADPRLAAALAAALAESFARAGPQRDRGPSSISMLAATTGFGFALLTAAMGWLLIEIHANRDRVDNLATRLSGEIQANRDRLDGVETRLSGEIQSLSQRLTRIETLLEERLPARR